MKILAFGEVLFDVIEGVPYLGGAPLNFAAHLAKCGADSYILSRVGKDELGKLAFVEIEKLNLKSEFLQWDAELNTGTVEVQLKDGQPDYEIVNSVAYDFIDAEDILKNIQVGGFDLLYYGTLAQRSEVSRNTLKKIIEAGNFKNIFYDINLRKDFWTKEIIEYSLLNCTIFKLNDEEVIILSKLLYDSELEFKEFAERVCIDYSIRIIIITAGAKGCYIFEGGNLNFVQGYPAKVVDTVGAGDSFSATFIFRLLKTGNAITAADVANRIGAFVASSRGAIPNYTQEIEDILNSNVKV
jgi:fructokinase